MKQVAWKQFILIILMLSLTACGSDESDPDEILPQRGDLVSATAVGSISTIDFAAELAVLALAGIDTSGMSILYNVGSYRVVYKTMDTSGRLINASGVIAVPAKSAGTLSPILGYQHPTIFLDSAAPSNTAANDTYTLLAASLGYIMVIPDYIGFGESNTQIHTYVHAEGLANATVDMLRAAKKFLANNNIGWNDQLFLTGYSEGGYANMAAHRELETNLSAEFTVTAAVHGGGPYDVRGTMDVLLSDDANVLPSPAYIGFVFKAYDSIYGLNAIADTYLTQTQIDVINTYYDGLHSSSATDVALGTDIVGLLYNPTFLTDYRAGGDARFAPVFDANQVYNWTPSAPTRLYHGTDDNIVPYANATTAMTFMSGAADIALDTCSIPVDAHALCAPGYLGYMIDFFDTMATNL
jgi:predicted esterase